MISVLFVCLGNICRSPMAEAVFQQQVDEAGLSDEIAVDSAGTIGYHVGERAHPGTRRILAQNGIHYNGRSRQVQPADVADGQYYLIAMDDQNLADLQRMAGNHDHLYRLLDFADHTDVVNVPDPYYSNNFETVYKLIQDGSSGLLQYIRQTEGI